MARYFSCTQCHRHVHADDPSCPFCGFGPLRCEAPPPVRWALSLSIAAMAMGATVACTGKGEAPSDEPASSDPKPATPAPNPSPEVPTPAEPDPGQAEAEPTPDPERQVDIYGGPRMTAGDPEDAPVDEPEVDDPPTDDGDRIEPAEKPQERRPLKYGLPRRDDLDGPKPG